MAIHTEMREAVFIVSPCGEFSKNIAAEMREILSAALDDGVTKMVFDFSGLSRISSDGLRVILESIKKLRNFKGRGAIVGLEDRVRAVFEVGGFFTLLDEFDTIELAIASFTHVSDLPTGE